MDSEGKIVTVTGPIEPECLGVTMTHEHLLSDLSSLYIPPKEEDSKLTDVDIQMKYLGWIRQNPKCHKANLRLCEEVEAITEEMLTYKHYGGKSIVENTSYGFGRNKESLQLLKSVSEDSGINIIAGTGFYINQCQTASTLATKEETLADIMRSDLTKGLGGIRCGLIGEVGISYPITEFEKKSLRSSAIVQSELGCPIMIHPGRDRRSPDEILRIMLEAGGRADRTVMGHLDRTLQDPNDLLEFAKNGTFLEYDLFGIEISHYQGSDTCDMPNDGQRMAALKLMVDNGLEDRITVGHDMHTKHRLTKYGGHGYSHFIVNVAPKMLRRGFTQVQVDKILKHNPKRWLTIV